MRIEENRREEGWYEVPGGVSREAYWNGAEWTGTTRTAPKDPVDPGWIVFLRSAVWLTIFVLLAIGALFLIGAIERV